MAVTALRVFPPLFSRTKSFDQFLMNVKAIEALAGVEFFPGLPAAVRTTLQNSKPKKVWNVPAS